MLAGLPMLEGLPPNNATHVMRLACDEATARQVADIIVETFDPAEAAAAAFEDETSTQDWRPGRWIVEAYFGTAPDEVALRSLIACTVDESAAEAITFDEIAMRDWVANALAGLSAVRAGRFVLHGSHDRGTASANDIAIEIEAALAFGTGHHGSTRGCLLMLDRLAKQNRPQTILDVGTGSGVLAIAAAKRFHRPVFAGDIDPVAIAAARANAKQNGVADRMHFVVAPGLQHQGLQAHAPYDLVFANILAKPLRRLAPAIAAVLAPGGTVILSGLLGCDVAGVLSAYRGQGLALETRLNIEGWATLRLSRGALRQKPRFKRPPPQLVLSVPL